MAPRGAVDIRQGRAELRQARSESRGAFWAVGVFSAVVNILMLTGPLYMLNVYDRVLGSRSVETLLALTFLVGFLYGMMGILDYVRGRVMARVGARFQARLDRRVFSAVLRATTMNRAPEAAKTGLRDLEAVQRMMISLVFLALYDVPFVPIFILGIFIFHPLLGWLAVTGGAILVIVALVNQFTSRPALERSNAATYRSELLGNQIRGESEMVQSLGMRGAAFARWQASRGEALASGIGASDLGGVWGALTKSMRLFLQSAMLGLGAWLVLQNQLSPGAMIAGSILLGRALAPVEMLINQWAVIQRGREGWGRLAELLSEMPEEAERTPLPKPRAILEAVQVTVLPPGEAQATLRSLSFRIEPGQAVGVIGPSGSGKSTLARAITGVWRTAGGKIRLDGAALDQYDPDVLGAHVGYLPQRVQLFEGTIGENIARMATRPDAAEIVQAAKRAAAHEMILKLPDGYDTQVGSVDGRLSGGQIQRIGLARAMYGDPVVLVLDEPNSNLDNEGSQALNAAIKAFKAEGKCILIMAHRPAAIQQCDLLLVLDNGARRAFGPKDEVLKEMVQNHQQIRASTGTGGVS